MIEYTIGQFFNLSLYLGYNNIRYEYVLCMYKRLNYELKWWIPNGLFLMKLE